jgi:hypothetical protein
MEPLDNVNPEPETHQLAERLEGWTVQLVSHREPERAWDNWDALQKKHQTLLKNAAAAVIRADLGDRGIYYRLRVHKLDSKSRARDLCRSLKRRGTNCFVAHAT